MKGWKGLRHRTMTPYWAEVIQAVLYGALAAYYAVAAVLSQYHWEDYALSLIWVVLAFTRAMLARNIRRREAWEGSVLLKIELRTEGFSIAAGASGLTGLPVPLPAMLRQMAQSIEESPP